jgi:HD superfamily phosphodiesterase
MTRQQAHAYLSEAGRMNPGPWVGHSRHVALAAENIAKQIDMDPELAYTMGLLHDIGRREGVFQLRNGMDGYKYLINRRLSRPCPNLYYPQLYGERQEQLRTL